MNIHIFEPQLIQRRGYNGFYRHFLTALVRECGARPGSDPRPPPRVPTTSPPSLSQPSITKLRPYHHPGAPSAGAPR